MRMHTVLELPLKLFVFVCLYILQNLYTLTSTLHNIHVKLLIQNQKIHILNIVIT